MPNRVIKTCKELEEKFLERFFTTTRFIERKAEITQFEQQETESLYDACERFNLLIHKFPNHNMSDMKQMQNFINGLQAQVQMLLDASIGGTIRTLTEPQVKELIEKMSLNEYNFANTRGLNTLETKNKFHIELTLGGYEKILTKLEVLNPKSDTSCTTQESPNNVIFVLCTDCEEERFVGDCIEDLLRGEVQSVTMLSNLRATQTYT